MEYGIVFRPKAGQYVSGDAYLIADLGGVYLAAVADGLGSGEDAAQAARRAIAIVGENVWEPLPAILRRCHQALHNTRGAVMGILRIEGQSRRVSYAGVGNIDLRSRSASGFQPINAYGILGSRLPEVRACEGVYTPGDLFVLSSDGITRQFNLDRLPMRAGLSPQMLAEQIAASFSRTEDDVTVLVMT